jgi:hypothetical protein
MSSGWPDQVSPAEIADLLAQARILTQAGAAVDPARRAAYLSAKAELLARIADQHAHDHPCHADTAQRVAADARTTAQQAAALTSPTPGEIP